MLTKPKIVTITRCSTPIEAYILQGKLKSAGIQAFVADANTVAVNWFYSNAIGGVKVQVKEEDAVKALAIISETENKVDHPNTNTNVDASHCPKCNSQNIKSYKYSKLAVVFAFIFIFIPFPLLQKKLECMDCGHVWQL